MTFRSRVFPSTVCVFVSLGFKLRPLGLVVIPFLLSHLVGPKYFYLITNIILICNLLKLRMSSVRDAVAVVFTDRVLLSPLSRS